MRVRRYQVFQVYQIIFVRKQLINSKHLPINNYNNFGDIESEVQYLESQICNLHQRLGDFVRS